MIFSKEYNGPCPKDCPRRAPGCHNAATCENWAKHEKKQKERREKNKAYLAAQRMSWEQRKANESR